MNQEPIAEVLPDSPDSAHYSDATPEVDMSGEEYPFYIVPRPPIPGQTSWSTVPW
jgi:hypothetical protein